MIISNNDILPLLGLDSGYKVKYSSPSLEVPSGFSFGNSLRQRAVFDCRSLVSSQYRQSTLHIVAANITELSINKIYATRQESSIGAMVYFYDSQYVSVTHILCLSSSFCVCHKQSLSSTTINSVCMSKTDTVCNRKSLCVTDRL